MKWLLILLLLVTSASITYFYFKPITNRHITPHPPVVQKPPLANNAEAAKRKQQLAAARNWCAVHNFSQAVFCLIDLSVPSGRNRFFVYDAAGKISLSGLVAHGNCNTQWLEEARFSNKVGCGCSSVGHYKIGGLYNGNYGQAFKLLGLDSSNSNAYARNVVLHSYKCVPDAECYPYPICNSQGCAMVAPAFMAKLVPVLKAQKKPVLLWVVK